MKGICFCLTETDEHITFVIQNRPMFRRIFPLCLLITFFCEPLRATKYDELFQHPVFEKVSITTNVPYGRAKTQAGVDQKLTLDVYEPLGDTLGKRPLVILAHGGFFLVGDKGSFEHDCIKLAESGFVAVSINYRLIDVAESKVAYKRAVVDAVFDMKAAVRFFRRDAATTNIFRIDPENIFIGGYSAGAITSLHYGYVNTPADVYAMGGNLMLNYIRLHGGAEGNSGNEGYSSAVRGILNLAGALHHAGLVDANEPPLFSVHGTADDIVPFETGISGHSDVTTEGSGLIHQRADSVGLVNKLIRIEGANHFAYFECDTCPAVLRQFIVANLKK